jgi:thymidine kinase
MVKKGKLTLYTGNMFGGKTTQLITDYLNSKKTNVLSEIIKPCIDTRYSSKAIVNHNKVSINASFIVDIEHPEEIFTKIKDSTEHLFIDEVSLFNHEYGSIYKVICILLEEGINITASGLLFDFKHEFFPEVKKLFKIADRKKDLLSRCSVCDEICNRTQRMIIINDEKRPARYDDPIILVGGTEFYEPRCDIHHVISKDKNAVNGQKEMDR